MGFAKITFDNSTMIDLTSDTVSASTLLQGYTAHDSSGEQITGTMTQSGGDAVLGNKTITQNGTYNASTDNLDGYSKVEVNVPATTPSLQLKTATPSETAQTITADSGYDGLSSVKVEAISSTYVGSGVARKTSTDLAVNGATVTVPSGYYADQVTKSVASGTEGTPTASKGTVSNHAISITPSVTNSEGYISGGTRTGTSISVSASELVSGSQTITENGTVDVTNLANITVEIPIVTYYVGTVEPSADDYNEGDIYLKVGGN